MPVITLPDGSQKKFDHPVTVAEVAASIGPGLAKAALAGKLDENLVDVSHPIKHDAKLSIITERDAEGLEIIRHSTAHLLAQAVKQLFPEAQVTIGPVIEDGFYYDFAYKRPFTRDDLVAIEERMTMLAAHDQPVSRTVMQRDEAVKFFRDMGERYKAEIIASIPNDQEISLYSQGEFIDLCRGPHVPSTGKLKAFHLTKVAGAYWRGDSNNEMLQRIYGTAWADKKSLQAYLTRIEEAEKRDHRRLGRELDLYHMQEEAPGLAFWHAKGWTIWQVVEQYLRHVYRDNGYQEVRCPQILDKSLWEKTGHWQNYRESMFTTASENRDYAIKPMNCPGHVLIYNHGLHSYRELPIRYGEFGSCTRNEPSGALHGLMRVRGFVQDDGHIFCTEGQIESEVVAFHRQAMQVYADFGFSDIGLKIALRPNPEKRIGSDEVWDKSEEALRSALRICRVKWQELPGEGAFYGPKIEYHMQDAIGRTWQVGTMQVDFSMPGRLGAEYVGEDGSKYVPVMLHRAIVGSMERFLGILIEHHAGRFPAWLAPVQAVVLTITDRQSEFARQTAETLKNQGLRVESDLRNEKIGFKIREHTLQRVPYLLVVGDREQETGSVAVRTRDGKDLGSLTIEAFAQHLTAEVDSRGVSA
ncbi:MAG TPA: threonine--tRNA ligase [Gammaproteobacteria bacterium]|nr:threonine--tRNA ligase [Gammaproteobacteria bacterium]